MAGVIHPHPQIDFHPLPVDHSPSPLAFGFGLSATQASSPGFGRPNPAHASHLPLQQLVNAMSQPSPSKPQKRRYEPEDDSEILGRPRDVAMDRSPTPERPKRAAPKRAKTFQVGDGGKKDDKNKSGKQQTSNNDDEVDVGVLLASLPPQSLLPILNALLSSHSELKPAVLALIPRPTLDAAVQALAQAAKQLREAYPYSNSASFSQTSTSTSYGFGSGFWSCADQCNRFLQRRVRIRSVRTSAIPFGQPSTGGSNGGMRDDYILSRLGPHISGFVSACFTYLPYFSFLPGTSAHLAGNGLSHAAITQMKDRTHPNETFQFLSAVTVHILSQPPLAQAPLATELVPRLKEEWLAWVTRVDVIVNREGGMFGSEMLRGWLRGLEDFGEAKGNGLEFLHDVRNRWVASVGLLVGRRASPMEQ